MARRPKPNKVHGKLDLHTYSTGVYKGTGAGNMPHLIVTDLNRAEKSLREHASDQGNVGVKKRMAAFRDYYPRRMAYASPAAQNLLKTAKTSKLDMGRDEIGRMAGTILSDHAMPEGLAKHTLGDAQLAFVHTPGKGDSWARIYQGVKSVTPFEKELRNLHEWRKNNKLSEGEYRDQLKSMGKQLADINSAADMHAGKYIENYLNLLQSRKGSGLNSARLNMDFGQHNIVTVRRKDGSEELKVMEPVISGRSVRSAFNWPFHFLRYGIEGHPFAGYRFRQGDKKGGYRWRQVSARGTPSKNSAMLKRWEKNLQEGHNPMTEKMGWGAGNLKDWAIGKKWHGHYEGRVKRGLNGMPNEEFRIVRKINPNEVLKE